MRVRHRRASRPKGVAAVEMAVVLPLFIVLVLGTIEASRLGMVSQRLHLAAHEGCRTAVQPSQTEATVRKRVNDALAGTGIAPTVQISSSSGHWTTAPATARITVRLSVPFEAVSWLGDPFAFGDATVVSSATMASEKGN